MRLLKERDLRSVLAVVQELHSSERPEAFGFEALGIMLKLVPARDASFNRLEMKSVRLLCQGYPKKTLEPLSEPSRQNFIRFQDQHPFVTLYRETAGFAPVRTTDLMPQEQFERLAIYNEYYRPSNSRYQIEFTLPASRDVCLCMVLDRPDKNFSERDRAVLTLLQPHLAERYRTTRQQLEQATLARCTDPQRGAVLISPSGDVHYFTPSAASLVSKYFDEPISSNLPEAIRRWLAHHEASFASEACFAQSHRSLVIERGSHRLEVQTVREGGNQMLLLRECNAPPSPAQLTTLGLTPRQAEVLYLIAEGKTNWEIGTILGASHHTIHQHVNAILTKLGVENRASAMLRALEVLGVPKHQTVL